VIVVFDASTLVSAAPKADSLPERALLRAIGNPHRLIVSQEVENEDREVLLRPKFDRFVSADRRRRILDIVIFAAERIEPARRCASAAIRRTTNIWRWRSPDRPM
jgi:predicted nucleic acid-binding protein